MKRLIHYSDRQEWQTFRFDALAGAGHKCQCCGATDKRLSIKYRKSVDIFPESAFEPTNAVVLCSLCFSSPFLTVETGGFSNFYERPEWRAIRATRLKRDPHKCTSCHRWVQDTRDIHVDHIKPKYTYPELALCIWNTDLKCRACNLGKGGTLYDQNAVQDRVREATARIRMGGLEIDRMLARFASGRLETDMGQQIAQEWAKYKIEEIESGEDPWKLSEAQARARSRFNFIATPEGETIALGVF